MFEPLTLGCKVEFVKKYKRYKRADSADAEDILYTSKILEINEDGIVCAMPISERRMVPLDSGERYEVYFYVRKSIYRADCSVIMRKKVESMYAVVIKPDTELKKFQRREYFRLQCTTGVVVRQMTEEEVQYYIREGYFPPKFESEEDKCIIIDISGGGVRIFSKNTYEKGTNLAVTFPITVSGQNKLMKLVGNVVLSVPSPNDKTIYDNRVQFISIDKADRDDIIKFIFEQQRSSMRKEKN